MSIIRQLGKAMFAAADLVLPSPRGPRILIYHQVGADLGRQMEVSVDDFVWQLDWLAQNRQVVALDEALERWEEKAAENLVVLTFDDGYRDTYSTAYPLMKERGMPFTLYLATDAIESGEHSPRAEPLTWDQIEQMIDTGLVTIGAHTHTHADMRSLSPVEITEEIETSNRLIEDRTGVTPVHFAYPWGYWAAHADGLVRKHYLTASIGAPSIKWKQKRDRYQIHRFPVQFSDGSMWFASRVRGGLVAEESVRRGLRGYRGP